MDEGTNGKSRNSESLYIHGGNDDSESKVIGLEVGKVFDKRPERTIDQEICDQVDRSQHSSNSTDGRAGGTIDVGGTSENTSNSIVILINSEEAVADSAACVSGGNGNLEATSSELEARTVVVGKLEKSVSEEGKNSCVIDVTTCGSDGKFDENEERVCRICHLSSECTVSKVVMDLIQLGCGCKDELGVAHTHCAEMWFRLKGNRFCEICGETAKNVIWGNNSMELNETGLMGSSSNSLNNRGCWRGQPFCNFLMACLVIAFVLPWFFRVDMF